MRLIDECWVGPQFAKVWLQGGKYTPKKPCKMKIAKLEAEIQPKDILVTGEKKF